MTDNRKHTDAVIQNLKDAGCDKDTIKQFLELAKAGEKQGQLKLLEKHRRTLLQLVHQKEKQIDCLDYLVYQMKNKEREKMGKNILVLCTSPRKGGNTEMQADVLVFATPIYFYEMSGQMKTLLDRTNPLFPGEYAFRDIYLLAASADEEESSMDGAVKGLEGWISCFGRCHLAGAVRGVGADKKGEMEKKQEHLKAAYELGKNA